MGVTIGILSRSKTSLKPLNFGVLEDSVGTRNLVKRGRNSKYTKIYL